MGKKQKILIADDEDFIRKLISRILSMEGFEVIQAENGESAISLFYENYEDIRLVVLDIRMPDKSGLDVFKCLSEKNSEVRVIFCSGYGNDDVPTDERLFFIQKPFSVKDFKDMIQRVFGASEEEVRRNNEKIMRFRFAEDKVENTYLPAYPQI